MKLSKLPLGECEAFFETDIPFEAPVCVQGGTVEKAGALSRVNSRRFKLFTDSTDYVKILRGSGFVKWSRGELPFSEGDVIVAEKVGEYEINGADCFLVSRR